MRASKKVVDRIVWLLRNRPGEWEFTQYRAKHKSSGVDVWVANWIFFCAPCDGGGNSRPGYGPVARWRLWRATRAARLAQTHRSLADSLEADPS